MISKNRKSLLSQAQNLRNRYFIKRKKGSNVVPLKREFLSMIKGRINVSCQALENEPLQGTGIMTRMAQSAIMGGASAIRANGVEDIREIKAKFEILLVGLIKRQSESFPVYYHYIGRCNRCPSIRSRCGSD
ncbi:hypothetical protein Y696_06660 [Mesotoga sp. H07pep.5.4]|nr:hypothetical protein Y696_06660 [Mesotoga sp. H07pep.5.4]